MTVEALCREMSHDEYLDWQALMMVEPYGEMRMDARFGVMGAGLANMWIVKGKPLKPDMFIPSWKKRGPVVQSVEEMKARFDIWKAAVNQKFAKVENDGN